MQSFTLRIFCYLTLLLAGSGLGAQSVGDFLNEMNTAPGADAAYGAEMETYLEGFQSETVDTARLRAYAAELWTYADEVGATPTGDKAELYGYFMLNRIGDYADVIARYEARMEAYNLRATTTIFDLYRRAVMRSHGLDLSEFDALTELQAQRVTDTAVAAFYDQKLDLQPGQPVPDVAFSDLDGRAYSFAELQGKVVLLDFWATWCGPCMRAHPEVERLHEEFRDHPDFVLISVSLDETDAEVRRYLDTHPLEWVQVRDPYTKTETGSRHAGPIAMAFRARGLPKYFLIDREGRIVYNSHLNGMGMVPADMIRAQLAK